MAIPTPVEAARRQAMPSRRACGSQQTHRTITGQQSAARGPLLRQQHAVGMPEVSAAMRNWWTSRATDQVTAAVQVFAKAGIRKKTAEDAVDAERHGLLPSWRLKMPVVEWYAVATVNGD